MPRSCGEPSARRFAFQSDGGENAARQALTLAAVGRQIVLVTGPPGAGKSTLGEALAVELGFALFAKDRLKEMLHDALGGQPGVGVDGQPGVGVDGQPGVGVHGQPDLAWSRWLGGAAMQLLWALAAGAPAAVLEANFWPDDPRHLAHVRALGTVPVEVHCACPIEECLRRYAERAPTRHAVHVDRDASRASVAGFERSARPLGLGPVVRVDTTAPVEVVALAVRVRRLLPATVSRSPAGGVSAS